MPAAATWKYLENQFDAATRGSRPALNKVVQDFNAKLTTSANAPGANPLLTTMLNDFAPFKTTWDTEHEEWQNMAATRKGSTVSFETLLSNLTSSPGPEQASKIESWDSQIRVSAPKGSSLYVTLLPQGRKPFSTGGYDAILNEVKNLGQRLNASGDGTLKTLGVEVTAYFTSMESARAKQQGFEGALMQESEDMTPARRDIVDELYGNLGLLMHLYRKNREMTAGFFDLQTLRRNAKSEPTPTPTP